MIELRGAVFEDVYNALFAEFVAWAPGVNFKAWQPVRELGVMWNIVVFREDDGRASVVEVTERDARGLPGQRTDVARPRARARVRRPHVDRFRAVEAAHGDARWEVARVGGTETVSGYRIGACRVCDGERVVVVG